MDDIKAQMIQIANAIPKEYGTLCERRVMAIMALPQYREYSVTKKCIWSGVSRPQWYRIIAKPAFREASIKYAKELLGNVGFDALNKYVQVGLAGNPYILERILQQLTVLDKPEKASNNTSVSVNIVQVEQKRTENVEKGLNRFGFTVRNSNSD